MSKIKLTEYSHGAGCGCKLSPEVLKQLIEKSGANTTYDSLLVGNQSSDDAAVVQINEHQAVVSTTDFFMPIVDDPRNFGRIAATNAISDIYAMGATPIMAIAIFGWPIDKLPASVGRDVLNGGREVCDQLGFPLAGGHSIDSPEPIYGLSVTGLINIDRLKRNNEAKVGDRLFLSKPLGVGLVTTAQKRGLVSDTHIKSAIESMTTPNVFGMHAARIRGVNAMTDVTGFGLAGHAAELARGANVAVQLNVNDLPLLPGASEYLKQGCVPGGTLRNESALKDELYGGKAEARYLACDPQTSGGLLIAVEESSVSELFVCADKQNQLLVEIGSVTAGDGVHLI